MVDSEPELSSNGSSFGAIGEPIPLIVLCLLCAVAWAGAGCSAPASHTDSSDIEATISMATVESIIDGDTVVLDIDGQSERVRLIGIDTPESVNPNVPEQCWGAEASNALEELIPEGSQVRIERDVEARDRYDRLLLYLYRESDDLFVNHWLVDNGFAESVSYPPNIAFQHDLDQARDRAASQPVGLWAWCDGPDQPLQ